MQPGRMAAVTVPDVRTLPAQRHGRGYVLPGAGVRRARMHDAAGTPSLGVYVHWPYCARICPYCDFNVYKARPVDEQGWIDAFVRDLGYWAGRTRGRRLTSLYFGGGTPSLAPLRVIEAVIVACTNLWGFLPGPEITIEANPSDACPARFSALAALGVNRLSLGVQSLRDDALRFLGRNHTVRDAYRALDTAQAVFPVTGMDLIYARPGQTAGEWQAELGQALDTGVRHLSLYQLTVGPGTAFARQVAKKRWVPAGDEECADQFDLAQDMTRDAGMPPYEISSFAAGTDHSRHNRLYWTFQDYIGIGPGAHGRITENGRRLATLTERCPDTYRNGACPPRLSALTEDEQVVERISCGLRLYEGMVLERSDPFFRRPEAMEKLDRLVAGGFVSWTGTRLAATRQGIPLLDRILYDLL